MKKYQIVALAGVAVVGFMWWRGRQLGAMPINAGTIAAGAGAGAAAPIVSTGGSEASYITAGGTSTVQELLTKPLAMGYVKTLDDVRQFWADRQYGTTFAQDAAGGPGAGGVGAAGGAGAGASAGGAGW